MILIRSSSMHKREVEVEVEKERKKNRIECFENNRFFSFFYG